VLGGYGEPLGSEGKLELSILVPIPDTNGTRNLVQGLILEKKMLILHLVERIRLGSSPVLFNPD